MKPSILFCFLLAAQILVSQNQELEDALKNQDYEKVVILAKDLLEKQPNDFNGVFSLGMSYARLKQFDNAIPYLNNALKIAEDDWQFAWLHTYLAEAYFSIGHKDLALEHYEKTKNFKGTKNSNNYLKRIELLFGFDDVYKDWKTVETDNIIFHFQDTSIIKDIDTYIKKREKAFVKINSFFNSKLPKKIDFFVWKNIEETRKVLGPKTVLGFTRPEYCVSHNRPNQSYGHEIAHNISHWYSNGEAVKNRFMNEGIAVAFDQYIDKSDIAKKVFDIKTTSIETLWKNPIAYPEKIIYPIAGVFVTELVNFDKEKFLMLCNNQAFESAQQIYGSDLQKLIERVESKLSD